MTDIDAGNLEGFFDELETYEREVNTLFAKLSQRYGYNVAHTIWTNAAKRPRGKRVTNPNKMVDDWMLALTNLGVSRKSAAEWILRQRYRDPETGELGARWFPPDKSDDPVGTLFERLKRPKRREKKSRQPSKAKSPTGGQRLGEQAKS